MTTLPIESQKTAQIRFVLNGEETDVSFAPYKTLLEVLREDLGHTGTKHGCELGECGACAVLLEGKPVLSCLVLALECGGKQVLTVEGMAEDGNLHPLILFDSRQPRKDTPAASADALGTSPRRRQEFTTNGGG